jgi:cytochrome P450
MTDQQDHTAASMSEDVRNLDREVIRELFDLRSNNNLLAGGHYTADPYPIWHRLREEAPVHPGTLHDLTGCDGDPMFHGLPYPESPHFTAFSYAACDEAYRNDKVFASSPMAVTGSVDDVGFESSMLMMGGAKHRRYRMLVQPSFVPAKAQWWISKWIEDTATALADRIYEEGRAELNVDFCASIPVLTITGSFGIPVANALDVRRTLRDPMAMIEMLAPIVAARREQPEDDLISVLVTAELTEEDGSRHRLSDPEIYSFVYLLMLAGSGTTWKQMGIVLAALLARPKLLAAIREDRSLLRPAIEESLRWMPTDPMFSRWVTEDIDFHGVHLPKGSVLHLCLGSANRDPSRWDDPDEYDPGRKLKPSLGFGGGPHVCLGMHVARAEMTVGVGALLDRLPNLRLDPDAEPPEPVGFYERGVMEINVIFDS